MSPRTSTYPRIWLDVSSDAVVQRSAKSERPQALVSLSQKLHMTTQVFDCSQFPALPRPTRRHSICCTRTWKLRKVADSRCLRSRATTSHPQFLSNQMTNRHTPCQHPRRYPLTQSKKHVAWISSFSFFTGVGNRGFLAQSDLLMTAMIPFPIMSPVTDKRADDVTTTTNFQINSLLHRLTQPPNPGLEFSARAKTASQRSTAEKGIVIWDPWGRRQQV